MALKPLDRSIPVVDLDGRPQQVLHLFSQEVYVMSTATGSGSPEGLVEGRQGRQYIDLSAPQGSRLYLKMLSDISGNKKMGWELA